MKKKILSALLAAAMVLTSCLPVFAEGEVQPQPIPETPAIVNEEAEELCECGLAKDHEGECQKAAEEFCECGLAKGHEGDCQKAAEEFCECGLAKGHEGECQKAAEEFCECGLAKGHEGECQKAAEEFCECGLAKGHEGECQKAAEEFCECGLAKGHEGECQKAAVVPEAPVQPEVPKCSCEAAEGEAHKERCPLYVAPKDPEKSTVNPIKLSVEVNGLTFTVSGSLPEGTTLEIEALEDVVYDYIHTNLLSLEEMTAGYTGTAYDIKLMNDGMEIEPTNNITVTVQSADITEKTDVEVYHLPNTSADDIYSAYQEDVIGIAMMKLQNEMKDITGVQISDVKVSEGYFEFVTDGFSVYYIVAGNSSGNDFGDTTITEVPSEDSIYYVEPGTIIEFTSGTFLGDSVDGITRNNRTITVAQDAVLDTKAVFRVEVSGPFGWGSYTSSLTFIVSNRTAVIKGAIANHPVYLSILTSGENGIPSEPGTTEGDFTRYNSSYEANARGEWENYTFANTAEGIISEGITDKLILSVDGSSTVGVYDATGSLTSLSYLSGINWDTMLNKAVEARATATDGKRVTEVNKSNYVVIPYVIKLMAEKGTGWHIDCAVVPANSITLSYNLNLKNYVITGDTPVLPNAVTGNKKIESKVGSIENVAVGVPLQATLNGESYDVTFLGWSKDPNATKADPSLDPGQSITVTENTVLYAVWTGKQTSGAMKVQKTVVFEDENDERKDKDVDYTFTIKINNAEEGKAYPYIIYNRDNSVKAQDCEPVNEGSITLLDGEYVIVNNVPAGEVTITEYVSADSGFDVSWKVGSNTTTTEGNTVTTTVTAGNQTNIECINTYAPLTTNLTITKDGGKTGEVFIMKVTGDGQEFEVVVPANGSVTITGLKVGAIYTVTEDTSWAWRYEVTNPAAITLQANPSNNTVTVKNEFKNNNWLSGTGYGKNLWGSDTIIPSGDINKTEGGSN